jgi:hypothetical protein
MVIISGKSPIWVGKTILERGEGNIRPSRIGVLTHDSHFSPAIAALQSQWHTLHDLDRAKAVLAINKSGVSTREIALHLHLSESLLRHLLTALQAPPEDRSLARQGRMSTNEVVRRARTAGIRSTARHREAREFERTQASIQDAGRFVSGSKLNAFQRLTASRSSPKLGDSWLWLNWAKSSPRAPHRPTCPPRRLFNDAGPLNRRSTRTALWTGLHAGSRSGPFMP